MESFLHTHLHCLNQDILKLINTIFNKFELINYEPLNSILQFYCDGYEINIFIFSLQSKNTFQRTCLNFDLKVI